MSELDAGEEFIKRTREAIANYDRERGVTGPAMELEQIKELIRAVISGQVPAIELKKALE